MIRTLSELSGSNWNLFWTVTGGKENCVHSYEEMDAIKEDEYSATYKCILCDAILEYDVSDIGD